MKFTIKRKAKPRKGGSFTKVVGVGANSVRFKGKIGSKKLAPGTYVLTVVATDFGKHTSKPVKVTFKVLG